MAALARRRQGSLFWRQQALTFARARAREKQCGAVTQRAGGAAGAGGGLSASTKTPGCLRCYGVAANGLAGGTCGRAQFVVPRRVSALGLVVCAPPHVSRAVHRRPSASGACSRVGGLHVRVPLVRFPRLRGIGRSMGPSTSRRLARKRACAACTRPPRACVARASQD